MLLRAFIFSASLFCLSGCWPAATSYHSSRMLGLTHAAELSASEAKKTRAHLATGNAQLEEELAEVRLIVHSAEETARRCSARAVPAAAKQGSKPGKKGAYSKVRKTAEQAAPAAVSHAEPTSKPSAAPAAAEHKPASELPPAHSETPHAPAHS